MRSVEDELLGGPKAYGTHQFTSCIFYPCRNFPMQLVKSVNDIPHSPKGIGIFYSRRGKVTWPKTLELLEPCQGNSENM